MVPGSIGSFRGPALGSGAAKDDTAPIDTATTARSLPAPTPGCAAPERPPTVPTRASYGRVTDHLMPASVVAGAPGSHRSRGDRAVRRGVAPGGSSSRRIRRLLLPAGLVVAAWVAGLGGALVGNDLADRFDAPPRRPSTLGLTVAPTRATTGMPAGALGSTTAPIDVGAVAAAVGPSVVAIHRSAGVLTADASGTGLVVTSDGEIVTNAHVVGDATTVQVRLPGETEPRVGAVIAVDPANDLALVRIGVVGLLPAVFAAPDDVRVGDEVVAIGHALDLDGDPSVTRGVVSALDRTLATDNGVLNGLVQTDAAISSGNSGGPLVDARGHVVGINTAIAHGDADTAANSVGFAIGVAELLPELAALRGVAAGATLAQGYLGVGLEPRRDGGAGASVVQVELGSPADEGGLQVGDVVVQLDGAPVLGDEDLMATVRDLAPGTAVVLGVLRRGAPVEVPVVLGARASEK